MLDAVQPIKCLSKAFEHHMISFLKESFVLQENVDINIHTYLYMTNIPLQLNILSVIYIFTLPLIVYAIKLHILEMVALHFP